MTQTNKYNPESFLVSAVRALQEYAEDGFYGSVKDGNGQPIGDGAYEIIMEFPSDDDTLRNVPLPKTLIHFAVDNIDSTILGFGENVFRETYDAQALTITRQEGHQNLLNFDVGIWASNESGGTTARLRAFEILQYLFVGSMATERLHDATNNNDGQLELIRFGGGRFLRETINDVPVFRMVNCTLELRVFSRTPYPVVVPTIEDIVQNPELVINPHLTISP